MWEARPWGLSGEEEGDREPERRRPCPPGPGPRPTLRVSEIPTVGIGPLAGDLTQAGGHDEWVDVEDYRRAIKVRAKIILDWSG